ncbi:tail fiber domain-containing protein [Stenotrophomonas lactitubi]|uniref:tail fiber domain-containing protein n=1 Tax=Stenotrophomonas lactitubi TaxID=2045214 RepID=UPI003208204C
MLNLLARAAAEVVAPLADRAILFLAEDLAPYYKTSDGVVHPLVGPQGIQGEKGDQGIQGIQGETGPQGIGVPSGGTAGQFVQKTATSTQWAGAVDTTTDQTVGGVKTFTSISNWNLSANARIIYGEPGGDSAGISMFRGGWAAGAARRGDIRVRVGDLLLGVGAASDNSAPVNWVSIGPTFVRPTIPGIWSLGTVGNAWLNTFTAELTLTGDDAAKARSRASLGALGTVGDEDVAGIKTFIASQVRYSSTAPGHWFNEIGGNFSLFQVLDGDIMQWQLRNNGFANSVIVDMPLRFELANKVITTDYVVRPRTTNKDDLGTGTFYYRNLFVQNAPITGSDKRKKKNIRSMTSAEEAAFLAIAELESVWEWEVGDRIHGGPTVQDARDVMLGHDLDPWAYSCFCHDSWPAKEAVWREWPGQEEVWEEWPAQAAIYHVVPATYDDGGELLTPETHIMVSPPVEAGRRLVSEALEAGRELLEPAVDAGESFSFRVGELHAWMLAAMARRDRRLRVAAEQRLASIEQRLMALESGPAAQP